MSRDIEQIGMDVHKEAIVIAVCQWQWQAGDGVDCVTKASSILQLSTVWGSCM